MIFRDGGALNLGLRELIHPIREQRVRFDEQNPSILFFLATFALPRDPQEHPLLSEAQWRQLLGSDPQTVVRWLLDSGRLEAAPLGAQVHLKFSADTLRRLCREQQLPTSGSKRDLVLRLIAHDPDVMKSRLRGPSLLQCSKSGRDVIELQTGSPARFPFSLGPKTRYVASVAAQGIVGNAAFYAASEVLKSWLSGLSGPAYALSDVQALQKQSQFFVYDNFDSPLNHGFPSGLFGSSPAAMCKLHINTRCVYSASAADGCSTDPAAIDHTRGTVLQFTFDPLSAREFVGLNFEEPRHWGVFQKGVGYDLTGATRLVFDAISPTGGIRVLFGVNGRMTDLMNIPQRWSTITINLSSLGLTSLTGIHRLFGIASNGANAPRGGTVLLDKVHFL